MADPLRVVSDALTPVFSAIAGDATTSPPDPVVRPSDRADAQVNGALGLAKTLGASPRDIAQQVVDAGVLSSMCSHVEVAGPGFVNLNFAPEFLAGSIAEIARDERLGVPRVLAPLKVVVDYSSPNVAKEMHAGHLRTTIIGDAIVRILEFAGHEVRRENHIGDWGRPFGMLIEHLIDIGDDVAAAGFSQGDLDAFYKAANAKFDDDPEFAARARARVPKLQRYDAETMVYWQALVDMSTAYFNTVYDRLDVLLTDDDLAGESKYQQAMDDAFAELASRGLVGEDDGAQVIFPPGFSNRDGDPLPLIVKSSAGAYMYAMSDIACVYDRVVNLGVDVALYVVGAPQAQHFDMVFAVARMAGWLVEPIEFIHVGFGSIVGSDRKPLKSRSGDAVKLVDLIDEAIERAAIAVAERNPDLAPDQQQAVADMVGVGALKYGDLSADRVKDYVFDMDRMISFEGDTGPYLQYAHARICSIFRRAGLGPDTVSELLADPVVLLNDPAEHALSMRLLGFPTAFADTIESYAPHKLCTYLFDLAQEFSTFYERCSVLNADDDAVRNSRLVLCDVTRRTLATGLKLLGIAAPTEM